MEASPVLGHFFSFRALMMDLHVLSQRAASAQAMYRHCLLCEHRCGVDRTAGERGFCGAGPLARVWRYWVDYAEESPLVPSLLIYLSGCDLRCDFCISEASAFDPRRGRPLTADWLREILDWAAGQGARTLQWIGGEPTIHLPAILQALEQCQTRLPVVWKSDFYATPESLALLDGVVDTYLPDFKFGNSECALRIAGVPRYFEVVTRNLLDAATRGRLLVRHLLLPGHEDCCFRPILDWMRSHLPDVPLSIRNGYLPRWRAARHAELDRPLQRDAGERAIRLAASYGLQVLA